MCPVQAIGQCRAVPPPGTLIGVGGAGKNGEREGTSQFCRFGRRVCMEEGAGLFVSPWPWHNGTGSVAAGKHVAWLIPMTAS